MEGQLEFTGQQQRSCEPIHSEGCGGGLHNYTITWGLSRPNREIRTVLCGGTHEILGGGLRPWLEPQNEYLGKEGKSPRPWGGKPFSFRLKIIEILEDRRRKIQSIKFGDTE